MDKALHPPRGARSAVACRALSAAPTRPPRGTRVPRRGGSGTPLRRLGPGSGDAPVTFAPASSSRHQPPPHAPPSPLPVAASPGASGARAVAPSRNVGPIALQSCNRVISTSLAAASAADM